MNRRAELDQLHAAARTLSNGGREDLALLGHRKVGKTSLLLEFSRSVDVPNLRTLYLDLWETLPTLGDFIVRYLAVLLDALLIQSFQDASGRAPSRLISSSLHAGPERQAALMELGRFDSRTVRRAVECLNLALERRPDAHLLRESLDLPQEVAAELGLRFLVIFDEFQELDALNRAAPFKGTGGDVFALLRGRWQRHARVGYVVAGSRISMLRKMLLDHRAPFFQHFRVMAVEPFEEPDAVELFTRALADSGLEVTPDLLRTVIMVTGGHPFYLQILAGEMARTGSTDDDEALRVALQETLLEPSGRLSLYFADLVGKVVGRSTTLEQVLLLLARGHETVGAMSQQLGVNSGAVVTALNRLADIVVKRKGRYLVADPCLRIWLQNRTEIGAYLPALLVGTEAELLVARHLADLGFRSVYQSRASRGPFDLLAHLGTSVLALQVKKSQRPAYVPRTGLERLDEEARSLGFIPLLVIVEDGVPLFYEPNKLRRTARSGVVDGQAPRVEQILKLVFAGGATP